jgi:hypothetical protein
MNRLLIGSSDKTDLLLQFLTEDFQHGVTVLDPTGGFARHAANLLPVGLTQHALYLDPADMRHPVGLNVLEGVIKDDRQRLTEQLCATFDMLFPQGENTLTRAQSTFLLANCLRLLLDTEGTTLLGVLTLLSDKTYRSSLLESCDDPVVLKNWDLIAAWKEAQFADLYSKMGTLLMSPMIRNIVGQSTTLSPPIVIANLDRAKLGDTTAKLLGGLLLARTTGTVYITDLGFLSPSSFVQDRYTAALRFLDEVPKLRQAVLNTHHKYIFKTNRKDAEELARYVGLPNPQVLVDLD